MKKKKVLILLICFLLILFISRGTYAYKNYFTDTGKKQQCVINYIKSTNKGSVDNQYKAENFIDLLNISMFKKYKITSVEETKKTEGNKMRAYVVVDVNYINRITNESSEQLVAFLLVQENGKYKVENILKN